MDLLEGESLAGRLARGALPLADVLRYGEHIAAALDRAHRGGIIHRDLKPGNIMITKSGAKLLDFGLARSATPASSPDVVTALTEKGMVVGTFQYMAPEQLAGHDVDARTDIFALGAVLYEMTTGRRAFQGTTRESLMGAIVSGQPQRIREIQPLVPPALEHLVERCLAKDPDERWQSAHDIAQELRWIRESASGAGVIARRSPHKEMLAAAAALLVVAAVIVAYLLSRPRAGPGSVQRSFIAPPPGEQFFIDDRMFLALTVSPDGRYVTYNVGSNEYQPDLWLYSLATGESRRLGRGKAPFWSPDSKSIAFWGDGKLRRMDVAGGPTVVLADGDNGRGGTWNGDGTILYVSDWRDPVRRIPATGGTSTSVTTIDAAHGETTHRWPWFLPDGRHFLYMAGSHNTPADADVNAIYVGSLDSPKRTFLLRARSNAVYAEGYVLFVRENYLLAQPFDPDALEITGEPVRLAQNVTMTPGFFRAQFAVSQNGVLVYFTGPSHGKRTLKWMTLDGRELQKIVDCDLGSDLRLSPDDTHAVAAAGDPSDIWTVDLGRGTLTRLTSSAVNDMRPVWSPDGSRVAFLSDTSSDPAVVEQSSDGLTPAWHMMRVPGSSAAPSDWSHDGRNLLVEVTARGTTNADIWIVTRDGKPSPFIQTEFNERAPRFSPDGRWVIYVSDESGRDEAYVMRFPDRSEKKQLTNRGVFGVLWRKSDEILVVMSDLSLMRIAVDGDRFGVPQFVARLSPQVVGLDVTRDDKRLLAVEEQKFEPYPITLVTNWTRAVATAAR